MPLSKFIGAELSAISVLLWSVAASVPKKEYFLELDKTSVGLYSAALMH
jgi:hypothetical protein